MFNNVLVNALTQVVYLYLTPQNVSKMLFFLEATKWKINTTFSTSCAKCPHMDGAREELGLVFVIRNT